MVNVIPTLAEGGERMELAEEKRRVQKRRLEEIRDQLEEEKVVLEIAKVEIDRKKLALERKNTKRPPKT